MVGGFVNRNMHVSRSGWIRAKLNISDDFMLNQQPSEIFRYDGCWANPIEIDLQSINLGLPGTPCKHRTCLFDLDYLLLLFDLIK